ncbi:hypothetical protein LEP1GSC057_4679 [Leptospira interrogans str. Brem 329]|nr:hypothetical protein LEP1GSC057_4679 [Leptospira interrogans str. Brem 329]
MSLIKYPQSFRKILVVTHVRELEFPFYREKIYLLFVSIQ